MPENDQWNVQLAPAIPRWRQVHDRIAGMIQDGALAPGDHLPTTAALAKRFGVTVSTMQQALDALRRRGLLDRQPGQGTTVSAKAAAHTIGILFGRPALVGPDDRFHLLLWGHLVRLLRQEGWEARVYLPVDAEDAASTLDGIRRDADQGRLRALISLAESPAINAWVQDEAPVPTTRIQVAIDYPGLCAQGAARLAAQGCRHLALIPPDPWHHTACADAVAAALPAGVALSVLDPANQEDAGLARGRALAALPADRRPDGVVAANDNGARGLIAALLVAGLRIPGDLRVVSHANRGLPVFPGLEVTRLEIDPEQVAADTLAIARAAMAGTVLEPPPVRPQLVPGATG